MGIILDHLVVGGLTLAEAQTRVEDALGLPMQSGGAHAVFQTHNALMGLEDGIYLEAIAPNPDVPAPARPRWYDLDQFTGSARLSNWACAISDMDGEIGQMPDGVGAPVKVTRGDLRWRMAVSADGTTPFDNLWPAVIEWPDDVHPAQRLTPTGARLRRLTITHPDGAALATALARHLEDDRIAVEVGPAGLHATFDTPHGPRRL